MIGRDRRSWGIDGRRVGGGGVNVNGGWTGGCRTGFGRKRLTKEIGILSWGFLSHFFYFLGL